jgi:HEXXH motif-containing protein
MIGADPQTPWQPIWAKAAVDRVLAEAGFSVATYGTSRWLAKDPAGERLISGRGGTGNAREAAIIEALTPQATRRYAALDLRLSEKSDRVAEAQTLLAEAWLLIDRVPPLAQTIAALVRSIHVLDAPSHGFDVSHSDPELPCSIFLSLPMDQPFAALRAAESIVHEAMHLQLTLFEAEAPLVERHCQVTGFSPWQQRDRPLLGLVHGLFVFAAIDRFMALLIDAGLESQEEMFALKRRREVAAEIAEVAGLEDSVGLTTAGRTLVGSLLGRSPA